MIDRLIKYILIFTLASAVASCTDEILLDNQGIVEGDATVSSTIIFKDLAKSSLGGSRSAGNAVKQISNLCVLVYSADGSELKHHYYADAENGSHNFDSFSIDKEGNSGRPDGDNGTSAEGTTPSARLTFKITANTRCLPLPTWVISPAILILVSSARLWTDSNPSA